MKFLLDVNVLLAAIWENHSQHATAFSWLKGKKLVLCPISELGFIRISTNPKAVNAPMAKARLALRLFASERGAEWIPDDLPAQRSNATKSEEVTDSYLADLAESHGFQLATLDARIRHSAVHLIAR